MHQFVVHIVLYQKTHIAIALPLFLFVLVKFVRPNNRTCFTHTYIQRIAHTTLHIEFIYIICHGMEPFIILYFFFCMYKNTMCMDIKWIYRPTRAKTIWEWCVCIGIGMLSNVFISSRWRQPNNIEKILIAKAVVPVRFTEMWIVHT